MRWRISHRQDPAARELADRHYSRQNPGAPDFCPPGRVLVLMAFAPEGRALWVTSWPFSEYVKHRWAGAWMCSLFRNEGAGLSSSLILEAVAATRAVMGEPPPHGMVTFVDEAKTSGRRSRQAAPGRCFGAAGFVHVGRTVRRQLVALQLSPAAMPPAALPLGVLV